MDETTGTPGAPTIRAEAADGAAIAPPRPGERRFIEVSGQAELKFAFGLVDVAVSVVDVDVVLSFPNGGQIVLPALGLAALGENPPRLRFANQIKDGHDLIAAAGEVRLVENLPDLAVSDNSRARTAPTRQTPDTTTPEQPAQPTQQVVQLTSNDRYTAGSVPFSGSASEAAGPRPDPLLTGIARHSRARETEDPVVSNTRSEGALTERSDRTASQQGNVTLPPNRAPALTSAQQFELGENQGEVGRLTGSDPDNDRLTFAITGGRDSGRFALNGASGALFFVNPPDFERPSAADGSNIHEVEVQVSDGRNIARQTLRIAVSDVNEAPGGATLSGGRVAEHASTGTMVGVVRGDDPDAGSRLTYAFADGGDAGGRFQINAITGELTVARSDLLDFESAQTQLIVVRVTDQAGLFVDAPLLIRIDDANDAPVITSNGGGVIAAVTLPENVSDVTTVSAVDEDAGSVITYAIVGGDDAALFRIDSRTGELTLASAFDFEAPIDTDGDNIYRVVVEASDGQGGSDRQELAVTVVNRNDAPDVLEIDAAQVEENASAGVLIGTLTGRDPDSNAVLRYSFAPNGNSAGLFALDAITGELTVARPNGLDFEAASSHLVVVRVSDQFGLSLDRAFAIQVLDVDEPPILTSYGGAATVDLVVGEGTTVAATIAAVDPERLPLTYAIAGGADAAAFAIDAASGTLRFLATPNFEAPADTGGDNRFTVSVSVSDGRFTVVQTVNIQVADVGEPPIIVSGGGGDIASVTTPEGSLDAGVIAAIDHDLGSVLTYRIVGGADASRFIIDAASGELRFAGAPDFENPLDANLDNTYVVDVEASDGTLVDRQTVRVTVLNVNDPPVITSNGGGASATLSVPENQTVVTTVAASDPDAGATLLFTISGGADAGRFTIDAVTGTLRFLAAPDHEAPGDANGDNIYEVQVSVLDGVGGVDTQTLSVAVANQNEAPIITSFAGAASASLSLAENGAVVTTITATDPDAGATLAFSISGGADAARFTIDPFTGVLRFVTPPNFEAPVDAGGDNTYNVTVQVSDGLGGTDTQALAISVTNLNEAPVIVSPGVGPFITIDKAENSGTAVTTVIALDPDAGTSLTYAVVGGADAGRFTINATTGALALTLDPNFELPVDGDGQNTYDVVVQVSDGLGGIASQAITVRITDVNEAPVITSNGGGASIGLARPENTVIVTDVDATDVDAGAVLTYAIIGGADAARFVIDAMTGELRFSGGSDFEARADANGDNGYEVIVAVSDGSLSDTQLITVTLTDLNDSAPAIVSDGGGPTATISVWEGATLATTIVTVDPDTVGTRVLSIVGGADAARFTLDSATGQLRFVAPPDHENPTDSGSDNRYQVIVQVSDGVQTDTQAITVEVLNLNDNAPVIVSDGGGATASLMRAENGTAVTTVVATDADPGTTLTYSIVGGADAARFSIDAVSGELRFIAPPDFETAADGDANNVYVVVVAASDGVLSTTQTIQVAVADVNDVAPTILTPSTLTVNENTTFVTMLSASDPDSVGTSPAIFSIVGGADAGRFEIVTGALRFRPGNEPNFELPADAGSDGAYEVMVEASDGVNTATRTITVTTLDVNEAPTAVTLTSIAPTIVENSAIGTGIKVAFITVTDDALGVRNLGLSGADAASFEIRGAELFYVGPSPNFEAKASYAVTVTVDDPGIGATPDASASFGLGVVDINEAPTNIVLFGLHILPENLIGGIVGPISVVDPDAGPPHTFVVSDARFEVSGGSLRLRPGQSVDRETEASIALDITATDSGGLSVTRSFTITVVDADEFDVSAISDMNAAPDFVLENATPGTAVGITARATDADATNNGVTYNFAPGGNPGGLFAIDAVTGVVTLAGALDRETAASHVITVRATSQDSSTSTRSFTIAVGDVNDNAPVITSPAATSIAENGTVVMLLTSTDPDLTGTNPAVFTISGGADQALFTIVGNELRFIAPPDFEAPADADIDNIYEVEVTASDGVNVASQSIDVTVTDVIHVFTGTAGPDNVSATTEQLVATGLDGDDTLIGEALDDDLAGGNGSDTLEGGGGNDLLDGGPGADLLDAGDGDDAIDVDAGDTALGGAGDDDFIIDVSALTFPGLSVQGGSGIDTVSFLGAGTVHGSDLVAAISGVEVIDFTGPGIAAELANFRASDATALLGASGPALNLTLRLDANDSFSILDPAGDGFSHVQTGSVYTFYNSETVQDVTTEIARVTVV